jgi:hypothetical protein
MKIKFCLYISLTFLLFSLFGCLTDPEKRTEPVVPKMTQQDNAAGNITKEAEKKDELYESLHKVGWIKEDRYRALVFIITSDECRSSSIADIETKIKLAAYNHLQVELNPSLNRNASVQIKNLIDNFGKMIQRDKDCNSENIFFYDILKKDLKYDFERIKNIK